MHYTGVWPRHSDDSASCMTVVQVAAVHLCPEPWTIENGLLTPTMKLKRPTAQKHFQAQLDGLYKVIKP